MRVQPGMHGGDRGLQRNLEVCNALQRCACTPFATACNPWWNGRGRSTCCNCRVAREGKMAEIDWTRAALRLLLEQQAQGHPELWDSRHVLYKDARGARLNNNYLVIINYNNYYKK